MKKILFLSLALGLAGAGCASSAPTPAAPAQPAPVAPVASAPTPPSAEPVQLAAPLGSNGIIVKNQAPSDEITVADVVVAKPGFVAVFADKNGKAGDLAGVGPLLNAGETRTSPIRLRLPSKKGETYWVSLFVDNGDKTFDAKTDLAAKDAKGVAITQSIQIAE